MTARTFVVRVKPDGVPQPLNVARRARVGDLNRNARRLRRWRHDFPSRSPRSAEGYERTMKGAEGRRSVNTVIRISICAASVAWALACQRTDAQSSSALRHVAAVALPNVHGRIDHMAFDPARQRLFVAALGNDTVEVVDTAQDRHLRSIGGFHQPQGIALVADLGAVAVANGDTGTLQLVDNDTYATRWTIEIGGDADNVRYDGAEKRLYVAAEGGLYVVDPAAGKSVGKISIDGHPESFQLETTGTRMFANLPGLLRSQVVASDRTSMTVTARWTTQGCGGNYPMALDESSGRVFVGCRRPARMSMVDTQSGSFVSSIEIVGDTDDLFYDGIRQRLYVVGGDGFVDVFDRDADQLRQAGRISTRGGARTGLWVPSRNRLYVAVPERNGESAEIRVFEAEAKVP